MTDRLRVGLIGCGAMGQGHLQVWEQIPKATVVAVCDDYGASATRTGEQWGVPSFTSVQEMLEVAHLDAVDICTPSGQIGRAHV
mgnify:CR=1 FL=1